jgi:Zn-dependent protease
MGSLRLRLFGFPVEIQPSFWILALFVGYYGYGSKRAFLWIAVVLSSVLVHELGHATLARYYGQEPGIQLHALGGLTIWRPVTPLGRGQQVLIALAGPGAGLLLGVAALAALIASGGAARGETVAPSATVTALEVIAITNLFWSAVNLLPVLPFDGGHVLLHALGPRRRRLAVTISLVFGLLAAVWFVSRGSLFAAALFAFGGVGNFLAARRQNEVVARSDEQGGRP